MDHDTHGTADSKCPLMVRIQDAVRGSPASNVAFQVYSKAEDDSWTLFASGKTAKSGEVHALTNDEQFTKGMYKIVFETKAYWKTMGITAFHEYAEVVFLAHDPVHRHYIIVLLISPFSYTVTAVVSDPHE
ncbi:transthyretin isoform X2 [Rhinatrema bivittatum]|uniref:transthyretin isoform X2 n=1 Tax=Rhinatrema bivittatum TaxID=194408 RepID=UPI00112960C8|nr:transthyretin isoform X2 [Rhinatrema bivittatum]